MAFNGSGLFVRLYSWVNDAANGINIKADRMDGEMDGMAAGLSNCLTRDGQGKPSAAIDWNNQNLNNVNSLAVNTLAVANGATVPDVAAGDSSGKAANTKFVATAVAASSNSAPRVAGLTGNVNATTPLTKFDLTCNFVTLRNTNSATVTLYGPHSRTVDLGLAGAAVNGRDQVGVFAANSWVHLYWIWDGTTLGLIASLSATAPTLPTGYTHWCYATTIRWNASSNIVPAYVRGTDVTYEPADGVTLVLASGQATAFTAVSCASFVPPNAVRALMKFYLAGNDTVGGARYIYVRPTGTTHGGSTVAAAFLNTASAWFETINICPSELGTAQSIDYKLNAATNNGGGANISVMGYTVSNGDA